MAMWLLLLVSLMLLRSITAQYHQTDYSVKLDRIVVEDYNRTYFSNLKAGLDWYNRTTRVINGNATVLKNLSINLKVDIQVYKFLSNEFRFFPITMTVNACAEFDRNILGAKEFVAKYSNGPQKCPIKKGFYYVRHGVVDFSQYPPYIPTGTYKLEVKLYNNDEFMATMYAVGTVTEHNKSLG